MFLHNFVVLAVIDLTISIGVGVYFVYSRWYLKKDVTRIDVSLVLVLIQQFNKTINGKSQTNRDQKLDLLILQRHN